MKRSGILILASFFILPFTARSQNEGVKAASNPKSTDQSPMYTRTTREMAMMQNQGMAGGAIDPTINVYQTSEIYLEPGFVPGRIKLIDGSTLEDILLRYDIYHQQIQFIRFGDTLAFSKPDEIQCFMLGEKKFIYTGYDNDGKQAKGYFEIISEGDCKLMVHRTVLYHLNSDINPDKGETQYVRECEYYIAKHGDVAQPVKACRKGVLCAFNDKEDQIRDFMNDNNMKMNTCDQLKEVVEYYNSLP